MNKELIIQKIKELKLQEAKKEIENLKSKGENVTSLENKFNKASKNKKRQLKKNLFISSNKI